jgi:integrase
VAYGTLSGFIEAVNFATFVLGLPARDLGKPLVSAFTKGIRDKAATRRPERKLARPLKVSEVMHLEEMLGNDKVDLQDRYAAGAFLFAIYARCRWSDLKRVQDFDLDVALSIGKLVGFLGFSTFSHKTASQVAKHGLPMPLVAPIWGLCSPPWAMTWKRVAEAVKLGFAEHSKGPLLPAPGKDGGWTGRSVTSDEASKWLGELLKLCSSELEKVSSHSLKATTLSWMAKAGSDEHHRTILGHHSTGKKSLEIYSRDFLHPYARWRMSSGKCE